MRIYQNPMEAVREVERDLHEMGIQIQVQTMQDKYVANNVNYLTKEVRAYGFQVDSWSWNPDKALKVLHYIFKDEAKAHQGLQYILLEFQDRTSRTPSNPGRSYVVRKEIWKEFLHNERFAYTYSERLCPQWRKFFEELRVRPGTRQAVLNIHSNICPLHDLAEIGINIVEASADQRNAGGSGRIPCSLYYQAMIREQRLEWVYAMRSCDFYTHFPIDILLAMMLQSWVADILRLKPGMFTYFTGSLHAYKKDLDARGIF